MTPGPTRSPWRIAGDAAVAIPVALLLLPLWCLPRRAAIAAGRYYGHLLFFVYGPGRRAGQINLRRTYGAALTRSAARRATWQVFGAMGQSLAEGIQFARRSRGAADRGAADRGAADRGASLVDLEDETLNRRVLDDPRPKIFVTAHMGSWEVATAVAGMRAGGGAVVLRRLDNVVLDRIVQRLRTGRGAQLIEKHGAAFEALRTLRAGRHVAMLADENAGPRGVWVPFLGREASTYRLPGLLACQTGSPVVVAVAVRRPANRLLFRLAVLEPPPVPSAAAVTAMTRDIAAILDGWIREDPLQWRWIHWRWKTRPDGSEERYRRQDVTDAFVATDDTVPGAVGDLL